MIWAIPVMSNLADVRQYGYDHTNPSGSLNRLYP